MKSVMNDNVITITEQQFLKYTEERGLWNKNTAIKEIEKVGRLWTPLRTFFLKNPNEVNETDITLSKSELKNFIKNPNENE